MLRLPLYRRLALARDLRRVLRATRGTRGSGPRHGNATLPEPLRARLLAIPATAPVRAVVRPRPAAQDQAASWLLASPFTPLAASFALVVAIGLLVGNPYRAGAATFDQVRSEVSPAAGRLCAAATRVAAVSARLGESAVEALPRAGLEASRLVGTLQERIGQSTAKR